MFFFLFFSAFRDSLFSPQEEVVGGEEDSEEYSEEEEEVEENLAHRLFRQVRLEDISEGAFSR